MLNFEKLSKIYFSPSGTTEKIVNEVAKNFNMNRENYDLLSFDESKTFHDELVIIGIPVFDGRIPKLACKRLSKMKGTDTKAIVILNYGNIDYGDALLELVELLKENNFQIVGVATTVSQHSQFSEVGSNRPDASDMERINEFSQKIIEKRFQKPLFCKKMGLHTEELISKILMVNTMKLLCQSVITES
jgi:flavodoxin